MAQALYLLLVAAVTSFAFAFDGDLALDTSETSAMSTERPESRKEPVWSTDHKQGYCALYGTAGHRTDHDALDRPNNTRAQPVTGDSYRTLQTVCPQLTREAGGAVARYCCDERQISDLSHKIQIATIFLVGCPACAHNFKHFFCELTCSPDQATFANVTETQLAPDTNNTAVAQVDYFVSSQFGNAFYNSCKDVVYPIMSQKAMTFVGGGARNFSEWFSFLGLVKDKRFPHAGSPFQMNFPGEDALPPSMALLNSTIPPCWDAELKCSCGDCPDAPQCIPIAPPPPSTEGTCPALGLSRVRCSDVGLAFAWAAVIASLYAAFASHSSGHFMGFGALWPASSAGLAETQEWSDDKDYTEDQSGWRHQAWARARLCKHYRKQGEFCARRPWTVLLLGLVAVIACSLGLLRLHVETDPSKLWVGSRSQALAEKQQFEKSFGPFYRIEQLLLSTVAGGKGQYTTPGALPSILSDDHIKLLFKMQRHVDKLTATLKGGKKVKLTDVCYKPFGDVCATQSLLQFWQMNRTVYEKGDPTQHGRLSPEYCLSHWSTACRGAYGGPQDPHTVLGGFPLDNTFRNYTADASTFVVTYPLDSSSSLREAAVAWEAAFLKLAHRKLSRMAEKAGLRLAFSAERSVADELARESTADAATVAWSYAAMLVYVAVALTVVPRGSKVTALLVHSRIGLALGGIVCVAAAVAAALGVCSLVGVSATLIILEVIPFLVLAVGVDNMFILVNAARRQPLLIPSTGLPAPLSTRMGDALAEAGPSITLAAAAETLAFALGGFTPMPAVRNFSLVAALAVLLDFFLQVTVFVALLALDTARVEEARIDLLPLLRLPQLLSRRRRVSATASGNDEAVSGYQSLADADFADDTVGDLSYHGSHLRSHASSGDRGKELGLSVVLQAYVEHIHAPLLQQRWVQAIVLALFGSSVVFGLGMLPRLTRGLDQQVALPRDSYLQDYFQDVMQVMRVGPPVFFVVEDMNMTRSSPDVNHVCSISGCNDGSVTNLIAKASRQPAVSFIAAPAASWIDDFLTWISPDIPQCCRAHPDSSRCPPPDQEPCLSHPKACADCDTCFQPQPDDPEGSGGDLLVAQLTFGVASNSSTAVGVPSSSLITKYAPSEARSWHLQAPVAAYMRRGRPSLKQAQKKLPWFLEAKASEACAKGGAGAYTDLVQMNRSDRTGVAGLSEGLVSASAFRSAYVPLSKQSDFINSMRAARGLADQMAARSGLTVYTFSVFHVFFEQYLTIGRASVLILGSAVVAVGAVSWLLMGSLWAATMLAAVIAALLIQLAGLLPLLGVQLNAVSLVNLAMAAGISVEFCAHIVYAFLAAIGSRPARSFAALHRVGASVLSGITLTKLVGVAVLSRAQTQIFQVYFFRMYCGLVAYAVVHSLIVLPVLLSLMGPPPQQPLRPSTTNLSLQEELGAERD